MKRFVLTTPWLVMVDILICQAFLSTTALRLEDMNDNVNPIQDFYEFANGGWLRAHPSPPDEYPRYNLMTEVQEKMDNDLKVILEEESNKAPGWSQVGDMYASAMNQELISAGVSPLFGLQKRINDVTSTSDLMRLTASLHQISVYPWFKVAAATDPMGPGRTLLHLSQSFIAPHRDYYLLPQYEEIRTQYKAHLERVFSNLQTGSAAAPWADPQTAAEHVVYLETALAHAAPPTHAADFREMPVFELPGGRQLWEPYFEAAELSISDIGNVFVNSVNYFYRVSELVSNPRLLPHWNSYLHWYLIQSASPFIGKPFSDLRFQFFQRAMLGQQEPQPHWKTALRMIERELTTPLAKLYVERHFSVEAKNHCVKLIQVLVESLRERIRELKWMSPSTKMKALEKLDALTFKVGFPDKWDDFGNVEVDRSLSFIENIWIGARARWNREMARINTPVDPKRWATSPLQVGAFFLQNQNQIVFPAAILQRPLFFAPSPSEPRGDPTLSLGAIGAIIGHMMTQGFDNSGRHFDAKGNYQQWWTRKDEESFMRESETLVSQFRQYEVEGHRVDGRLTLLENIADVGGLKLAYTALKKFWVKYGPEPAPVDGFSTDQRFFLSYARVWREVSTREHALHILKVDVHAPAKYRVNGPLLHIPEFREAFRDRPGADDHFSQTEDSFEIW